MEEIVKVLITNGDKLGAVLILVLVIIGLVVLFSKGFIENPEELQRERDKCKKYEDQRDVLLGEVSEGKVNYAVAAERILRLDEDKKGCTERITRLEAQVDAHRSVRRQTEGDS